MLIQELPQHLRAQAHQILSQQHRESCLHLARYWKEHNASCYADYFQLLLDSTPTAEEEAEAVDSLMLIRSESVGIEPWMACIPNYEYRIRTHREDVMLARYESRHEL